MQPLQPPADSLPAPEGVLFDLDGTLVDSLGDLVLATDGMLQELGFAPAGAARVRQWVGRGIDVLLAEALNWADGDDRQPDGNAMRVFRRHYAEANGRTAEALPGAQALLDWLRDRELPMGLVTNKSRPFVLQLLDSLGWQAHFGAIVCGDDVRRKKPAADPILQAMQQLQLTPERVVMVGDSTYDVGAAQAAGVAAIRLAEGYGPTRQHDEAKAQWEGATLEAVLHWLQSP